MPETRVLRAGLIPAHPTVPDFAVLDGLSLREREVFITGSTVKSHVRSVLAKLELRTRIQLVAFAYEHHLLGS